MEMARTGVFQVDDGVDSCLSDIQIGKEDVTLDEQLPIASGAVRSAALPIDDEDTVDACEADFTKGAATADADLPPAAGGVG